ncbi:MULTISPECIES: site-2 protease family protein [unclassified Actinomyces]|uniref:site-2 protease family protein n=1 Tax=unclassified Actinomyces TaxID=2609248 RepID=UPI002017A074|nr:MULTISPECIES: site-2 protease family protein [unclassified Actinomyces]MCL3777524.1 site-2 protease family protein [Actinomyces sp. AC-20-1]MCL3790334.1 site-2 protease family protein [Actinomyces sp. 187325]MCL3792613.1 site-2 protease family protein [Actinomyces sp. 186855]MCL3795110.1 site-2 protease family protein [Actinomyces sp. 217892]
MTSTQRPARTSARGWVLGTVGGAPVVVAPTSLLLGLLLAGSWLPLVQSSLGALGWGTVIGVVVLTVMGVAVSVLLHELAHGLTGTLLGRRPVLYQLHLWGGRTTFGAATGWRPWKDALTSLAGPATNLVLWALCGWAQRSLDLPLGISFTLWALTWVNLALAVFNALPGLPLDGGHALAALVEQVSGRRRLGLRAAAWGGLGVVALIAWYWVLRPLVLLHRQPEAFNLMLVVLVAWPIASTCWRVLGLGRRSRAAARLDLRRLLQPVATVNAAAPVSRVRAILSDGARLVLVSDGVRLLGTVDAVGLDELGLLDEHAATAGQVCTALPARAVTSQLTGEQAAAALQAARSLSRWLLVVEGGTVLGAVPTGAR